MTADGDCIFHQISMTKYEAFNLKRDYDLDELARRHGFDVRQVEKVCRISDVLEDVSAIKFLRERLSLYGGTALTFIHSEKIYRLSVDLDFNYRHLDEKDWGETRKDIDAKLKELLYRQGYSSSDLAISASYPLARITVSYTNTLGTNDSFKLEIGYMRRIPVLKTESTEEFVHIGTHETFHVKTPAKEELFANKLCTLLYRGTPRDLFDVYRISKSKIDLEIFRKCSIIDSLMRGKPELHKLDIEKIVESINLDSNLRNVLQAEMLSKLDIDEMKEDVKEFSQKIMGYLTQNEINAIDRFYRLQQFEPNLIDNRGIFHSNIKDHPAIQRIAQKLSKEKKQD